MSTTTLRTITILTSTQDKLLMSSKDLSKKSLQLSKILWCLLQKISSTREYLSFINH